MIVTYRKRCMGVFPAPKLPYCVSWTVVCIRKAQPLLCIFSVVAALHKWRRPTIIFHI